MTVGDTWISWINAPILKRQTPSLTVLLDIVPEQILDHIHALLFGRTRSHGATSVTLETETNMILASGTKSCKEECFFSLCSFRPCLKSKQLYTSIPTQTVERLLKQFLWGAHSRVYSKELDPSFQKPGGWLKASFKADPVKSSSQQVSKESKSHTMQK